MSESESNSLLSQENVPTILVVTFILALLSLALNIYNFQRTSTVAVAVAGFEIRDAKGEKANNKADAAKMAAVEARVAALEAAGSAATAAAAAEAPAE